jgi:hypothetical protein
MQANKIFRFHALLLTAISIYSVNKVSIRESGRIFDKILACTDGCFNMNKNKNGRHSFSNHDFISLRFK